MLTLDIIINILNGQDITFSGEIIDTFLLGVALNFNYQQSTILPWGKKMYLNCLLIYL